MRFLASELAPVILRTLKDAGVESVASETVLVSVPRGRRGKSRYGFDQSEEICKFLSEKTGIPYEAGILRRRIGGREQKKLSRSERASNLKGLLYLRKDASLQGKTVILFDDIVTTGVSLSACVPLLRKAGADQLLFSALAVTGEEKHTRT
jgi:competence protein ComFC